MEGQWYSQRIHYPFYAYAAFLVLICIGLLCLQRYISSYSSNEAKTLGHGRVLQTAINDYVFQTGEYPARLEDVISHLPPDTSWPVNPYTAQPVADTGEITFNLATSVGNVCYERIIAGEGLEGYDAVMAQAGQVGFKLHVFGEEGVMRIYTGGRQTAEGSGELPVAVRPEE